MPTPSELRSGEVVTAPEHGAGMRDVYRNITIAIERLLKRKADAGPVEKKRIGKAITHLQCASDVLEPDG